MTDSPSINHHTLLITILLLGVFTRSFMLGQKVMFIDEGISWRVAKMPSVEKIVKYNRLEEHSPLPQILDHYWIHVAGDSVAALHLQSLIWSLLTLGVFTMFAFETLSRKAAFAAVTAFSLSAAVPNYAQMLRYPALCSLAVMLYLWALFRYMKKPSAGLLVLYTSGLIFSLYLHLYSLFFIIAMAAYFIVFGRRHKVNIWPVLAAHAVSIAAISPKFFLMASQGINALAERESLQGALEHLAQFPVGALVRVYYFFCAGDFIALETLPGFATCGIMLVFAIVVFAALFSKEHPREAWFFAFLIGTSVLLGFFAMIFKGSYFSSKYYVPLIGPFCLLLGMGTDRIRTWKPWAAPALAVAYAALSFSLLGFFYWGRMTRPENTKTVLESIAKESKPGDFINISPPYTFLFDYYWKGSLPVHDFSRDFDPATTPHNNIFLLTAGQRQLTEQRMLTWHQGAASQYKRVWILWILGRKNTEDTNGIAGAWLDSHYRKIKTIPYRMFTNTDEYSSELVLYEIIPVPNHRLPRNKKQSRRVMKSGFVAGTSSAQYNIHKSINKF